MKFANPSRSRLGAPFSATLPIADQVDKVDLIKRDVEAVVYLQPL